MSIKNTTKNKLLAGVGTTVLATLIATAAQAGDVQLTYGDLDFSGTGSAIATATANLSAGSVAVQDDAVSAAISGIDASDPDLEGTWEMQGGTLSSSSSDISVNRFDSTAIGNVLRTDVDLAAVAIDPGVFDPTDPDADPLPIDAEVGTGFAVLSSAVNTGDAQIGSTIDNNLLSLSYLDAASSSVGISNNEFVSVARLNDSRTTISDDVTADLVDTVFEGASAPGSVLFGQGPNDLSAQGTIAVGSSQLNTGTGTISDSQAVMSNNTLGVTLAEDVVAGTGTGDSDASGLSVEGNSLEAVYEGNRAATGVNLTSDTDMAGSISVANQQENEFTRTLGDDEDRAAVNLDSLMEINISDSISSAVTVSENRIGSDATGNVTTRGAVEDPAGNYLVVDSGVNITGAGVTAPGVAQGTLGLGDITNVNGNASGTTAAALGSFVLGNDQLIGDAATTSVTDNAQIRAVMNDVNPSSVDLLSNQIYANAQGNNGDNLLSLSGNSIDASSTVVSSQRIANAPTNALLGSARTPATEPTQSATGNFTLLGDGNFADISISSDVISASSGEVTVDMSEITDEDLYDAILADLQDRVTGSVAVSGSFGGNITISFSGGSFDFDGLTGNPADIASSNPIAQDGSLTLNGDPGSTGSPAGASVITRIAGNTISSSVSVDGNVFSAAAGGNLVQNRLNIEATTISGEGANVGEGSVSSEGANASGYVFSSIGDNTITSEQIVDAESDVVSAAYGSAGIDTIVDNAGDLSAGAVSNSGISVSDNHLQSTAHGNQATTSAALIGTTIGDDDALSANTATAVVTSAQYAEADASSTATFDVFAPMGSQGSHIDLSRNSSLAQTQVNSATNRITVDGGNVYGSGDSAVVTHGGIAFGQPGEGLATATHVLQNAQVADGDEATATADLLVRNVDNVLEDGAGIESSDVTADGNVARAMAKSNSAVNRVSVAGASTLSTSSGSMSTQYSNQVIDADSDLAIGLSLTAEQADQGLVSSALSIDDNQNIATGTANQANNQLTATGTSIEGPKSQLGSGFGLVGDLTLPAGAPAIPYLDRIAGSDFTADATFASANQQLSLEDVTATAETVIGTEQNTEAGVDASSVSLDRNLTLAQASGNVSKPSNQDEAGNALPAYTVLIDGTNVDVSAAALSRQIGGDAVTATASADLATDLTSIAGIAGSSVSLSGNQTGAYAVQNDATTTMLITGNSIAGTENDPSAGFGSGSKEVAALGGNATFDGASAIADYTLVSTQTSNGPIDSTATVDGQVLQAEGSISASSVMLNDNVVDSGATANRARNVVSLQGSSGVSATAAVTNAQDSTSDVNSRAAMVFDAINSGVGVGQLDASAITLNGNTGAATARGNEAQNSLEIASATGLTPVTRADFGYVGVGSGLDGGYYEGDGVGARADYAVLNAQTNSGAINAVGSGSVSPSSLIINNAGPINNSSASVSGNSLRADAAGNTAFNSISASVAPASTATSIAMASYQRNSGPVSARVVGTSLGIQSGNLANSSSGISGNTISTRAVGNSVSNAIRRK